MAALISDLYILDGGIPLGLHHPLIFKKQVEVKIIKENMHAIIGKRSTWMALGLFFLIALLNIAFLKSEEPIGHPLYTPSPAFHYFVSAQGGGSGFLFIFLPLFLSLVTGDLFITERKTSYMMFSCARMNVNTYISKKIMTIGLTSFIVLALAQTILLVYTIIAFPLVPPDPEQGVIYFAQKFFLEAPFLYSFLIIINSSLMAFFMGVLSVLSGIIFKNYYAAILTPYLLFIAISEILMSLPLVLNERFSSISYATAPLVMSGDYITLDFSWWVPIVYWLVLIVLFVLITLYVAEKNFKKERLI